MKTLVIGASGQAGWAILQALEARRHEAWGTYTTHPFPHGMPFDLDDPAGMRRVLEKLDPQWVCCPGGMTHVDGCQQDPQRAVRLNVEGPRALAELAASRGVRVCWFSTDYVFDGEAGPYRESDAPRPINVYGHSKLEGEQAVQAANPRSLVLRTSGVYGPDPQKKNFVYQAVARLRAGQEMPVFTDQFYTPTYTEDLAFVAVRLMEQDQRGLFHVAGSQSVSRLEYGQAICQVFGLPEALLRPMKTADLKLPTPRPLKCGLVSERIQPFVPVALSGPRAGLERLKVAVSPIGDQQALGEIDQDRAARARRS